jgi:hypothetical protein
MNIHPRLLDGNLKILQPGEKIHITISDKNPHHVHLVDYFEEKELQSSKETAS